MRQLLLVKLHKLLEMQLLQWVQMLKHWLKILSQLVFTLNRPISVVLQLVHIQKQQQITQSLWVVFLRLLVKEQQLLVY